MDFFVGGVVFILIILFVSVILAFLGLILGKKNSMNREKLTSFECGFDSLDSSRNTFSLRFFLLAVVFLIFDVEVVLFLPFISSLILGVGVVVKVFMSLFVLILVLGLVHEFNEGSLDWNK